MKEPSRTELERAREQFVALLRTPEAPERAFQELFSKCPYILSRSLPVRVQPSQLVSAVPGRSEADFTIYPSGQIPTAGVIELKRPDQKLVTRTRKTLVQFTRAAETAITQCLAYGAELQQRLGQSLGTIIGNDIYRFVIMGLRESTSGVDPEMLALLHQRASGCRLIPYDALLDSYTESIPPQLALLVPALPRSYRTLYVSLPRSSHNLSVQQLGYDVADLCIEFARTEMRTLSIARAGPGLGLPEREAVLGADAFLLISSGQMTDLQSDEYETAVLSGKDRWTLGISDGHSDDSGVPSPLKLIPRPRATRYYEAAERIWIRPRDAWREVLATQILPDISSQLQGSAPRSAGRKRPEFM